MLLPQDDSGEALDDPDETNIDLPRLVFEAGMAGSSAIATTTKAFEAQPDADSHSFAFDDSGVAEAAQEAALPELPSPAKFTAAQAEERAATQVRTERLALQMQDDRAANVALAVKIQIVACAFGTLVGQPPHSTQTPSEEWSKKLGTCCSTSRLR